MRTFCALGLWLCSGCVLLAGKGDYADYREVRLAADLQTRALAMQRYAARHPSGHWHEEIQSARASHDLAAFEAGKDSRSGIEHYLRAYPDGAFVAQARGRLSAIALIERRNRDAESQAQQLAAARKQRTEELRRTWVGRFIAYWTNTLTAVHAWGEPIADVAQANPQFSRAFAAQPRPRCTREECVKYYTSHYAVPVPGGNRIERSLSLVLRLRLRAGKLERAELLLPDGGFARWYELENRRAIADGDPEGRATATAWALERLIPIMGGIGPAATPGPEPRAPVIEPPAIRPTDELTDTSIEAPSDPQNRVSGQPDNAGIGTQAGVKPEPGVADLLKPTTQEAAPDMVFAPVGVGKQGQRVTLAPAAPKTPVPTDEASAGEVMIMDPVAVPNAEGTAAAAKAPQAIQAPQVTQAEPKIAPNTPGDAARAAWVRGFQWQGLHIVAFAAGADPRTGSYDGLLIERTAASGGSGRGKASPGKSVPRTH